MNCPNCQADNPANSKFCNNCGQRMPISCGMCGQVNPLGAKFCNNCGNRQDGEIPAVASPTPATPSPVRDSPPQTNLTPVTLKTTLKEPEPRPASQAGERRVVTFLFADIVGSTAAAGRLDPEEWAEIIGGVFERLIRPIKRYDGTVARLMGDAVLAFFGAPQAHEDDPQRAIMAGLDILAAMQPYQAQVKERWDVDFDVRVGINTGPVMVGQVGADGQVEYTALGDAINLASRMEQSAAPGTIQVSQETYRLVSHLFEFEDLGASQVKGKEAALQTYRPIRLRSQPGRVRGLSEMDVPLVGRAAEMELLKSAYSRLGRGVGGVVLLHSEAGLGKSRLVRELKSWATLHPVAWFEATALSFEAHQPYALFQHLLYNGWGILASDSPSVARSKIAAGLAPISWSEPEQTQRVFETLLGLEPTPGQARLEGELFKRELFQSVLDYGQGLKEATVLFFDDLHWADLASIELLQRLMEASESAPVLLLCAMRPERDSPAWGFSTVAKESFSHRTVVISLERLSDRDTDELVSELLSEPMAGQAGASPTGSPLDTSLPDELRSLILEKADGNPFFIEEVVRAMIDSGSLVRQSTPEGYTWQLAQVGEPLHLPGSLQALLTARIDRLEEETRRTLQLASVIGRSFYFRILESINQTVVTIRGEPLQRHLLALQRAELILEAARQPELEYTFRHSLTQEAAYNTILIKKRRQYHRQVGEAIETLFAGRLEEFYNILAHHFNEADDPRALHYDIQAGDKAFSLYAIAEALEHYERALTRARRQEAPADDLVHLYLRRGRLLEISFRFEQAVAGYQELEALGEARQDLNTVLAGMLARATVLAIPSPLQDPPQARLLLERCLELARQLEDPASEAKALWNFEIMSMYSGDVDGALFYGEQAVEIARRHQVRDVLAYALQDLGFPYMAHGELAKAGQAYQETLPIFRELGFLPMVVENLSNQAVLQFYNGNFDDVTRYAEEALHISTRIEDRWGIVNAKMETGMPYIARGQVDKALAALNPTIQEALAIKHPGVIFVYTQKFLLYRALGAAALALPEAQEGVVWAMGFPPFYPMSLINMAVLHAACGELVEASALVSQVEAHEMKKTLYNIGIEIRLTRALLATAESDFSGCLSILDEMLDFIRQTGGKFYIPETLLLQSKALRGLGRMAEAGAALEEARALTEAMDFRLILWQVLAAQAELATGEAAARLREQAREIADGIMATIEDEQLRQAFKKEILKQITLDE